MPSFHHDKHNNNSVLPALHHAFSGSLGTLVSTCTLYPLSLVIARLQVQRQLRREGRLSPPPAPSSPAPGPAPSSPRPHPPPPAPAQATTAPDTTARAPISPPTSPSREQQAPSSPPLPPLPDQATGGLPPQERDLERERNPRDPRDPQPRDQQGRSRGRPHSQPPSEHAGITDAFLQIWKSNGNGGLKAFYTGLAQDAPKSILDSFLFFLFYEWFRSLRLRSRRRSDRTKARGLGVVEEIAVGMAAGACSRSFTTPIANIVTRKQTATLLDPEGTASVGDIVRSIREEKGIAGFWSGYSASLVLTLNPSLTFFLQEFLKTTFAEKQYDDLGPRLTFLFAATSKAISSFVTYPFQTAKTRLQAGVAVDSSKDKEQTEREGRMTNGVASGFEEDVSESKDVAGENSNKPKRIRTVKNLAQQSIFGMVAQIVRSEGIGSLYDGIGAELLKGFFSHGITMVTKDVVHKLLFRLYLVALSVLAELRRRRLSMLGAETQQKLPRALQYRIDTRPRSLKTGKRGAGNGTNVVANLIDGTQRPFKAR